MCLCIDSCSQRLHDLRFLDGAARGYLLDERRLGLLHFFWLEGGEVRNDEGLEGVGDPPDLLVAPADALVL